MSETDQDGWRTILETVKMINNKNLFTRIRGHDLFACEAKYHQSCRNKYVQDPTKWCSTNTDYKSKQGA